MGLAGMHQLCLRSCALSLPTNELFTCLPLPRQNKEGKVVGARCKDNLSGEQVEVYAKVVINATGTLTDSIRKQSDAGATKCVTGSSGAHVTLPSFYGSEAMGLIIPKTRDGRVLFMLPWQVGSRSCAHLSYLLHLSEATRAVPSVRRHTGSADASCCKNTHLSSTDAGRAAVLLHAQG